MRTYVVVGNGKVKIVDAGSPDVAARLAARTFSIAENRKGIEFRVFAITDSAVVRVQYEHPNRETENEFLCDYGAIEVVTKFQKIEREGVFA